MNSSTTRAIALFGAVVLWGCVSDRPARNGVFNENQYVRKDFLIAPASDDGTSQDPGWFVQTSILSTSTPNPLANVNGAGLFAGAQGIGPNFVRFKLYQDKLEMVDIREINNDPIIGQQQQRQPAVVDAWPSSNVDLKYRVNLDGETTNFYEENQENDWQVRQWIKINFAKNDLNDLFAFGGNTSPVILKCTNYTEAAATLEPGSFVANETDKTMKFVVNLTWPIYFDDTNAATCLEAFGAAGVEFFRMNRQNVTMSIAYNFVRPEKVVDGTYVPMPVTEKDPIRHKYGAFEMTPLYRDQSSGLLSAQQLVMRFDPNKDIVYYFAPGVPKEYRDFFAKTMADKTTGDILAKTGGKTKSGEATKLRFLNFDDFKEYGDGKGVDGEGGPNKTTIGRQYGDPRYSFINWHSDLDNGSGLLGIAQFFSDPRTGETISATVNVFEGPFKDTVQQRLELFLTTVGQQYLLPNGDFDDSKYGGSSCKDGDQIPLVPGNVAGQLNQASTVYGKMQQYLQKPTATYGYLGPSNFVPPHNADFYNAYFAVLPYQVYSDPQANPFVTPEISDYVAAGAKHWKALGRQAEFHQVASQIDHGVDPYATEGPDAIKGAVSFAAKWESLAEDVNYNQFANFYRPGMQAADDATLFSYFDVYAKNGRHCVGGKWESRADYTTHLIQSLNEGVAVHEFGHTLGLRHNFMGSVDQRNFPLDPTGKPMMFSSSIMDYNQFISEAFFETNGASTGWGPYDAAALGWIYSNNLAANAVGPAPAPQGSVSKGISGQVSNTLPWKDPLGFQAGTTEVPYLFCTDDHLAYTPMCRQYDMGSTPSEIMANGIQQREWNYLWTNFRLYHKYADFSQYDVSVVRDFGEMRRFLALWDFDWSGGELTNTLRLIGTPVPVGANAAEYYNQLTDKFNTDISVANQLGAAYHRAIIEQGSGERPFITVYDPFFGDTTQQGIQLDKVEATTSFSTLWPAISNFDPSQAGNFYISSVGGTIGDSTYTTVSQATLVDFLGAGFATYTYAQLGPLANFAATTHSTSYNGNPALQSWVGGWAFERERDFLDFVHSIAIKNQFTNCDENGVNCSPCKTLDNCTWDPRTLQVKPNHLTQSDRYYRFQGPDGRTYIWGFLKSRNQWILADRDRNVATYKLMLDWNTDVVNNLDDGTNGAQALEFKVRYAVDAFRYYDGQALAAP